MRKQVILLVIIIQMLGTTGCWSRVEVNDIAIVTAVGVDKTEDNQILVTLQLALPRLLGPAGIRGTGGEGIQAKATWLVSGSEKTVVDAYRRLQEKLPRRIFFSHSRVLIIGEKLAREGVGPILDFFSRHREFRLNSYILFTKGEAASILKFTPKFERLGSEVIREEEKSNIMVAQTLREFLQIRLEEGEEPVATKIAIIPSEEKSRNDSQEQDARSKEEKNLVMDGVAAFHQDKLAGWLNDSEGRGLSWLRNEVKTSIITVDIPKEKGNGQVSILVFDAKTNVKPILQDENLSIELEVYAQGDITENTSKLDVSDPKVISYIQKKLENDLKNRMQLTLDKAQKQFKSDIIGFGRSVHQAYPSYWRNQLKDRWDQEFPQVKVKLTPHVTVIGTGLSTKSYIWEDTEFKKR